MKRLIFIATLFVTAPTYAQQASGDHSAHHPAPVQASAQNSLVDGEVRKVDMDARKITLRHGAIPNLEMPPMTMVFQVKDPALLGQFKAGDKVRFLAEKSGSAYTVTSMETVK